MSFRVGRLGTGFGRLGGGGKSVPRNPNLPLNTVPPTVTGTATEGQTLTKTGNGTWTGAATITFTQQWWRTMPDELIPGATGTTYVLTATDVGREVYCKVTGTNGFGSDSANSNSVGPVAGGGGAVASTWDPAFASANMEFSAGNSVATVDNSAGFVVQFTRGTVVKNTGKRYFEIRVDTNANLASEEMYGRIGLVDNTYTVGSGIPGSANSKGFYSRLDQGFFVGAQGDSVVYYVTGNPPTLDNDIYGFAVDLDAQTITGVYKNGTLMIASGSAYPWSWGTVATKSVYPYCTSQWQAVAGTFTSFTLNCAGPFALATLPSGYAAWDT